MKMQDAMDLIHGKPNGYMVHFEWIKSPFLNSDYFPDKHAGETLIPHEHEAWELAERFSRVTKGRTCDIYVIDDRFMPVNDYQLRMIKNR